MEFQTIKRGQQIFNVCAYNFCQIGVERNSEEWDSTKRVYYKENTDEIIIEEWTVHSIGKKVMRLIDSKGNMKKDAIYSNWFNPDRWANSKEEAIEMAKKAYNEDKYKRENLRITFRNEKFTEPQTV